MIRIEYCRINSNLSQIQVAQRTGVTVATVRDWENGTAFPSKLRIMRLSRLFGVSAEYLLDQTPVEDSKTI